MAVDIVTSTGTIATATLSVIFTRATAPFTTCLGTK